MSSPQRSNSAPLQPTPDWPSPPPSSTSKSSSSHSQGSHCSMNTIMKNLLSEAARSTATPPPEAPSTSQPPPPTLQDLITESSTAPTHYQDHKLITNPINLHYYKTGKVIGYTAGTGNSTIYNGVYWVNDADEQENMHAFDLYVAMRVDDLKPQEEHEKVVDQVARNRQLSPHPNILIVREDITLDDQYWVVFDLMDKSLRCLMKSSSVFTNGLPLELVAIALEEVLKALVYIHQQGQLHRELNAGHIYYTLNKPAIKIGFLATIYEPNNSGGHDDDQGQYLPVSKICEWGGAPEIYKMNQEHTNKSDVWLVGITAMELVYGSIQVKNRNEFEVLVNSVVKKVRSGKGKGKKVGRYVKKVVKKMGISIGSKSKKKRMKRCFRDMLSKCLMQNAEERPTADALLQHDLFKICQGNSIYHFKKAVESARRE